MVLRLASLAVPELLSDAEALTARVGAGWLGVLWLTALPLRLLQAHFLDRLIELSETAGGYGNYLGELSLAIGIAFLLALWGRALYVRACSLALGAGRRPGREVLRLPAGPFFNYVYVALALELMMLALALTILPVPIFILLAGIAAGGWELTGAPHLLRPWGAIFEHARRFIALLGAQLVLGLAFLVVGLNLFMLFYLALWVGTGAAGLDLARWQVLLSFDNPSFLWLVAAGALVLLEPFWLAACTVHVRRTRARTSGEDLRSWWAGLENKRSLSEGSAFS